MLTWLLSSPHVQAATGTPDKGLPTLLKSRKGEKRVHSELSCAPAWKVCFSDVSNVPRKGICFVLGGGKERFVEGPHLNWNSSRCVHVLTWKSTKLNTLSFPVNWNIYMYMYIRVYMCACVYIYTNTEWLLGVFNTNFKIVFRKLLRHCDKFRRRK